MLTWTVDASFKQSAALERARAIPQAEREKILRTCAEIARQIEPEEDERIFGESLRNPPIPPEFAALQAMRVNVRKGHAHFKLHYFFDSGVSIGVDKLDTPTPSAVLWWGEMGEQEPWAELKGTQ
ncbi:hypothetical protein [Haloferula sp. BvORR071]|uniref:hypothetical protein n=1 Tax=Haloferula sp. BvORR071 TaxID=1396141 RepID=UPI000555853E|nr:hypothetical protein [Haloferula sp. BvORR071]